MQQTKAKPQFFTATRMATIALFSALAAVLYCLNFPISFAFPSWLELNFSDIPVFIGTFALGPVSGCIIVTVKILLKVIVLGTTTGFVGELADLIIGLGLVIPAGLIYKKHRTLKGAIVAMAVGSLCSTAIALLANWLILIPFYSGVYGMDTLVSLMQGLFPDCTKENFYSYYLWISVLPFNLLRCLIACIVTLPIYKRISNTITRLGAKLDPPVKAEDGAEAVAKNKKRTIIIACVAVGVALILVAAVLIRYYCF
ncbi:MAG: ECF transporter S component [Clostridia bacterium]|nr:ECF transporter S component [Clostridia bacterium]